jgi:mercuric ion transport protein
MHETEALRVDPQRCLQFLLHCRDISTDMGARCHEGNVVVLDGGNMKNRLLKIGVVGSIITAICCFTPALVLLLGAVGFASLIGYLDIVLLPALVIFLGLTGYALWKRSKAQ